MDNDITFKKCWQSDAVFGIIGNIGSTGRLIVVHAGSENGFVENAALIFKAGQTSGDYHGQMNQDNFTKWLETQLLPNIPPECIIVLDNAPYHSAVDNKPPTKSAVKVHMMEWLSKNKIPFSETMRKPELFEIINRHKPLEKKYKIDSLIRQFGHIPLRLPPYMCELNPIELAWAQVKRYIREKNTAGNFTIKKLQELTTEAVSSVTHENWRGFVRHVMKIEDDYWEHDKFLEPLVDDIIINLGPDDSDSSEDECEGSSPSSSGSDTD